MTNVAKRVRVLYAENNLVKLSSLLSKAAMIFSRTNSYILALFILGSLGMYPMDPPQEQLKPAASVSQLISDGIGRGIGDAVATGIVNTVAHHAAGLTRNATERAGAAMLGGMVNGLFSLAFAKGDTLHEACEKGNLGMVKATITENRDQIDELDRSGYSLLTLATYHGHTQLVELLLERGATIHFPSALLISAVSRGHSAVARLLLERGADCNAIDKEGKPVLHHAAKHGHLSSVELLIERGANVHALDHSQLTALQIAIQFNHNEIAQLLVSAMEKQAVPQQPGWGKFMKSFFIAQPVTDKESFFKAAQTGDTKKVRSFLAAKRIDGSSLDEAEITALHKAALEGHRDVVVALLEYGVPVDIQTRCGSTPLHYATRSGHTAVVKLLLESGASINSKDKWGDTPSMAAGFSVEKCIKYLDLIQSLVCYGAVTRHGIDTTKIAARQRLVAEIIFNDERVALSRIRALITSGAHNDLHDLHEALICAASKGYPEIGEVLLSELRKRAMVWQKIQEALTCAIRNKNHLCTELISKFLAEHGQSTPPRQGAQPTSQNNYQKIDWI